MSSLMLGPEGHFPGGYQHPNPMFDFLSGYVPRKLKDLFRWTEYLFFNSSHIYRALAKLSDYVITSITLNTDSANMRERYEDLFKKKRIVNTLRACSRDRHIYGNSFLGVYLPRMRMLPCEHCGKSTALKKLTYEYDAKKMTFKFACPHCDQTGSTPLSKLKETKLKDPAGINFIRFDPKLIDIDQNPITGETAYYYTIPSWFKKRVKQGDRHFINGTPKEFLECVAKDYLFKFREGTLYHMKVDAPAGVDMAWGLPPLTSVIKQFYYTQVLRKANEAIALDHLVPFRVLHPAQVSGQGDPLEILSMAEWVDELEDNLMKWRQDPLHIMFAPVALGVTQMGGQGRTLSTLGEVEASENNIMAGIGVPREFLHGGLSFTGSSVTLRMLENQLLTHKADIEDLLQWMADQIGDFMGWASVDTGITNFKFVDDAQHKAMLLQSQGAFPLSQRTLAEAMEIDVDKEIEQVKKEALDDARRELDMQVELEKIHSSLAQQAAGATSQGDGLGYDQQAVIAQAAGLAEQLVGVDEGTRRSYLSQLEGEDAVMYAVVIQQLEQMRTTETAEARAQMRGEG